jgi:thiamine-monophosphate kinase
MGAVPELAVLTLGLPRHTTVEQVEDFYRGMGECAARWRVAVAGGDIVSSPVLTINVTAFGACAAGQLRRSAGKPGDLLAVTGWLGRSGGGLRLLERGIPGSLADGPSGELIQAHVRPIPRIEAAACLVAAGVRCAMDVSDGLRGDTAHICEQSHCAASIELERIPLHPYLIDEFGREDSLSLALDGGEDYELLCAGPDVAIAHAAELIRDQTGEALTVIGRLDAPVAKGPSVTLRDSSGEVIDHTSRSWDHFKHG